MRRKDEENVILRSREMGKIRTIILLCWTKQGQSVETAVVYQFA